MREIRGINENESREQYINFVYNNKEILGYTNKEIAELINKELNTNYQESYIRGIKKNYSMGYEDGFENGLAKKSDKNAMQSIKEEIGELFIAKKEARTATTKLTKIKNEFMKSIELANDIKDYWEENDFKLVVDNYDCIKVDPSDNKAMIIQLSDWHIGLTINNCKNNSFNLAIAKERISLLLREIHKLIDLYDIEKVYVISTGDLIEHCYMRNNQHQNVEFYQAVQISETQRIIMGMLVDLSKICYVEFSGLSGNHDRNCGDKNMAMLYDNANTTILKNLQDILSYSDNKILKERLTINIDGLTSLELYKEICGVKCKFIHGDERIKDGKQLIQTDISMNEDFIDALFRGHWHNFKLESENNGRYIITSGCLSGYNDYSTKFGCGTVASQTVCIVENGKIELIKDIQLQ